MDARIQVLIVAVAASLVLLALPDQSFACDCVRELPAADGAGGARSEYQRWIASFNGVVFRGTVVALENVPYDGAVGPPELAAMTRKVAFRVERIWKGVSTSQVVIYTGQSDGTCGIPFVRGKSYLISADPPERPITTTCSAGYFKTEYEAGFVDALGPGVPPAQ